MPGLLNRGADAAGPTPAPAAQGNTMQEEAMPGEPVSPEEQEQFDSFVANGITLMVEGEGEQARVRPAILEKLQATEEWAQNLGHAVATIVMQLWQSAAKSGQQISGDVVYHGGKEILEAMVEATERAGIHDYSEEEMEGAFYTAADLVREQATAAGLMDAEALKSEWSQIAEAEQQGRLGEMLPGIEKAAARNGKPPMKDDEAAPVDDEEE